MTAVTRHLQLLYLTKWTPEALKNADCWSVASSLFKMPLFLVGLYPLVLPLLSTLKKKKKSVYGEKSFFFYYFLLSSLSNLGLASYLFFKMPFFFFPNCISTEGVAQSCPRLGHLSTQASWLAQQQVSVAHWSWPIKCPSCCAGCSFKCMGELEGRTCCAVCFLSMPSLCVVFGVYSSQPEEAASFHYLVCLMPWRCHSFSLLAGTDMIFLIISESLNLYD